MQIIKSEVIPVSLNTKQPVRMAGLADIVSVIAYFIRLETSDRRNAWGCSVSHPDLTGESHEHALEACQDAADLVCDLHPTNLEYSLAELEIVTRDSPAAQCAFDVAFHDLLGLATGMPLFRLLGGYRHKIQTSATIPICSVPETIEIAQELARKGFRFLKVKGGIDAGEDVERIKAIHRLLPHHILRLDCDGGYTLQQALDMSRALEGIIEMIEQPTPPDDMESMRSVTLNSPVAVLADQSVSGANSALKFAADRLADGISVKMATCGGFRSARQIDAIARAAQISTMVSCLIEPALSIAAGLSFALSSANVMYCDLDGNLELSQDPTLSSFKLDNGWLIASEVPGLGCSLAI